MVSLAFMDRTTPKDYDEGIDAEGNIKPGCEYSLSNFCISRAYGISQFTSGRTNTLSYCIASWRSHSVLSYLLIPRSSILTLRSATFLFQHSGDQSARRKPHPCLAKSIWHVSWSHLPKNLVRRLDLLLLKKTFDNSD